MRPRLAKYHLIRSILRSRLQREYTPGARLPTEFELCRMFNASRVTVQRALALLEKEGVIRREQGRGTFYVGEPPDSSTAKLSGLLESVLKYREGAHARVLDKRIIPASPRIAGHLRIRPDSPVVAIDRVAIVDEVPIVFIAAFLPADIGAPLLSEDAELSQRKSIVSILQDKYGIPVASVHQTIGAVLADPSFASALGVEFGEPVLEVERTYCDAAGRPVNFSLAFYRTDRYRFEVTLKEWR